MSSEARVVAGPGQASAVATTPPSPQGLTTPPSPQGQANPPLPQGQARFDLQFFAPGWGATVMGTAALSVALQVVGEGTRVGTFTTWAARATLVLAVALGGVVLGLTAARWIRYWDTALADLRHPVRGGMTATAPGGLLTLAVAIGRVGPGLPDGFLLPVVAVLSASGAVLALLMSGEFVAAMVHGHDVALGHVSGSWFVPPVVAVIVPLAIVPVIGLSPGLAGELLPVAWAFLGIGAVLYVVVTATLFARSVSHPLPPAALAPTLIIGMGPAGLLALDLVRLAQVSVAVGAADASLVNGILPVATASWGFGLWWMLAALRVLGRGYPTLPFALSWWAFTFPLAAWTVATVVLGRAWDSTLLATTGIVASVALTLLWGHVAGRTLLGIRRGTIWQY